MHLHNGRLIHNLEVISTIDLNSSNALRDIQEQLQLMQTKIKNMSTFMGGWSS
jgi:hypothetical protein